MEDCDFDFSLLSTDSNWKMYIGDNFRIHKSTQQCKLCNNLRKTFYCKNCVKNGDFIHSTSHFSERFAEKRLGVSRMQNIKSELINECDKRINILKVKESKIEDIRMHTEKITLLKTLVSEKRKKIERKKKMLGELRKFNQSARNNLVRNEECQSDLKSNTVKLIRKRPLLVNKMNDMKPQLIKLIRKRIQELVQLIFPINEIQTTKSSSLTSDSQEDIKSKLAEATRTAYIRGRWVFTDSWGETQHSIVAPTLPDSGDYSPYIHWGIFHFNKNTWLSITKFECASVSANKDNTLAMTSSSDVDHNPAYNISAALTYTTQLVHIIAHFLDIRLPNKLLYCEFCAKHLNERKFIKCVMHLNANILMLCLTQNVDPSLLQPPQTIRNLLLLLDTTHSDLGRLDPTDIDITCVSYLEDQLTHQIRSATARLSISDVEDDDRDNAGSDNIGNDDDDEYDSDHLSTDWEAVPLVSCPEAMPGSNLYRRNIINPTQTNSIAGGLVTSAAASIASIWRGLSINK